MLAENFFLTRVLAGKHAGRCAHRDFSYRDCAHQSCRTEGRKRRSCLAVLFTCLRFCEPTTLRACDSTSLQFLALGLWARIGRPTGRARRREERNADRCGRKRGDCASSSAPSALKWTCPGLVDVSSRSKPNGDEPCQEPVHHTPKNSGSESSSWYEPGERLRSWPTSSNQQSQPFAVG